MHSKGFRNYVGLVPGSSNRYAATMNHTTAADKQMPSPG